MPIQPLSLRPGVTTEQTPLLAEATFVSSNLIRFKDGLLQKRGGWTRYNGNTFTGTVRGILPWADLSGNQYIAGGSEQRLEVLSNGNLYDITPVQSFSHLANAVVTNSTTSVTINDPANNAAVGDWVNLPSSISVDGLLLQGFYQILTVGLNTYTIKVPVAATSSVTGGVTAVFTTTSTSNTVSVSLSNNKFIAGSVFTVGIPTYVGGITVSGQYVISSITTPGSVFTISATQAATANDTVPENSPLFTTTSGSPSVKVTLYNHSLSAGNPFVVSSSTVVGGLTLSGNYSVVTVIDGNNFTISAGTNATSAAQKSENYGYMAVQYLLSNGLASAQNVPGYGIGPYGLGPYGIGVFSGVPSPLRQWSLDNYGSFLMACPTNGPIYVWMPTGGVYNNPAQNISTAPQYNTWVFVAMPQQQIIALGSESPTTDLQDPMLVRFCDVSDYTDWTASVTNQAGSFRLSRGSKIVGGLQGPASQYIWTDVGFWVMQYIGFPLVYSFNEVGKGCGLISARAACVMDGILYWKAQNGFFKYIDGIVMPVPCPIWDTIFYNLNRVQLDKITCCPNSAFNEISWQFPSASGSGENDTEAKLNVLTGVWDFSTNFTRTAWYDQSIVGPPIGVDQNNLLQQHEMGNDADGQAMQCEATTGFFKLNNGTLLTFLERLIPDFFITGQSQSNYGAGNYGSGQYQQLIDAGLTITVYAVDYPWDDPDVFGPFPITAGTEWIIVRARGRLISIKIASNGTGTFWRLGSTLYKAWQTGTR